MIEDRVFNQQLAENTLALFVPLCLPVADRVENAKKKAKTPLCLCVFVPACCRQVSKMLKQK
jgi:hypothetical protein